MKLILVRHAETLQNRRRRIQGFLDVELSERGRKQAEAVAQTLKNEPVQAIYSSPLKRALSTARRIGRLHRVKIQVLDELKEMNLGSLDGLSWDEVSQRYPHFWENWLADATSVQIPDGESLLQVQTRAWAAVENILAQGYRDSVVLVSHFFPLVSLISKILDLPLSQFRKIGLGVGSISVLEFEGSRTVLRRLNDTCHLEGIA